jgi:hypothetical protein
MGLMDSPKWKFEIDVTVVWGSLHNLIHCISSAAHIGGSIIYFLTLTNKL